MVGNTILITLVLLTAGCASSGNPAVADESRTSQVLLDTSTKDDVKRILGRPTTVSRQSGGYPGLPTLRNVEVWSYSHVDVQVDGATFIPIVGLFAGGATSNVSVFTVVFDEQGIVRHISSTQTQGRSGMGSYGQGEPAAVPTSKKKE